MYNLPRLSGPAARQDVLDIVDRHDGFTADCIRELRATCGLDYRQMHKVRVCYDVTHESPETVQLMLEDAPAGALDSRNAEWPTFEAKGAV